MIHCEWFICELDWLQMLLNQQRTDSVIRLERVNCFGLLIETKNRPDMFNIQMIWLVELKSKLLTLKFSIVYCEWKTLLGWLY